MRNRFYTDFSFTVRYVAQKRLASIIDIPDPSPSKTKSPPSLGVCVKALQCACPRSLVGVT